MKLLIILYAVCVAMMLTAYIIIVWKAKDKSTRPWYWHGEYDQRRYLFTQDDLQQLATAPRRDKAKLTLCSDDYHVAPECVDAGHGIYYFTWCYWTEWGGLISELHQVTIHDSRATILFLHKETLHRYNCGWML